VEFEVANYRDMILAEHGALPPDQVRRARIRGVVDTGATDLVLPGKITKQLGLPKGDKIRARLADGRRITRNRAEDAYIEILGRHGTFQAIIEPNREDALIGAIVLEAFDLLPDCKRQRLVPRDPDFVLAVIE
jgi:clan AA aspartic protease